MREIVKVLLAEGIDEETIHEILDIIESTTDVALRKSRNAFEKIVQGGSPNENELWQERAKYNRIFNKALELRGQAKEDAQKKRIVQGQQPLETEKPKTERKQLDANFQRGSGSTLLLPRDTVLGTKQAIEKSIERHNNKSK